MLRNALFVLLAACGTPTPQPGGSANYSASLGSGPDFSPVHGRIVASTWFEYGENQLSGSFADGPTLRFHHEDAASGSCRLMRYTPTTCDPGCEGTDACIDGACVAYPERQDRGDLAWSWPDGEQTVTPDATRGYFATGTTAVPGDSSISFDGETLVAPTIDAPDADGDWAAAMSNRDPDATLRWSNPIEKARVRLHMTDCTGTHGGIAAAEVECEGPDTGTLVIPGVFLDAIDAGDWSRGECGVHKFQRYHAAAPVDDATIRFESVGPGDFYYRPE